MSEIPPTIPASTNFDTSYIRAAQVDSITDGTATLSNGTLSNINDPVNPKDAANMQYVLDNATGDPGTNRTWKTAVRVATTTNIALPFSGLTTIDGVLLDNSDRVLFKNQTDTTQNGIYTVDETANWFRSVDCPAGIQASGTSVFVTSGETNVNNMYFCNVVGLNGIPLNFGQAITYAIYGQSTAGGSNTQIQYNDAGNLAGSSNMVFNNGITTITELDTNNIQSSNSLIDATLLTNHESNITIGNSNTTSVSTNIYSYGGSLLLNGVSSAGGGNYYVGDIDIAGSNATQANYLPSNIDITAGSAVDFATSNGGSINITSGLGSKTGAGTSGGSVNITANQGNTTTGNGGSVTITAGSGGSASGSGGSINLVAGNSGGSNGNITMDSFGSVIVTGTGNSTSTTTGALVVDGGLGVVKNIYCGNLFTGTVSASAVIAGTLSGSLVLPNNNIFIGSSLGVATPEIIYGDATLTNIGQLTLATVATPGSFTNANITIDAKGRVLTASDGSSGSGSAPGGATGQIQYNNSGSFGGVSQWTSDSSNLIGSATSTLSLANNGSILLGNANDFQFVHNGSGNSLITSATGNLGLVNSNSTGSSYFQLGSTTVSSNFNIQDSSNNQLFTVYGSGLISASSLNVAGPSIFQTVTVGSMNSMSISTGTLNVANNSILQNTTISNLYAGSLYADIIDLPGISTSGLNVSQIANIQNLNASSSTLSYLNVTSSTVGTLDVTNGMTIGSLLTAGGSNVNILGSTYIQNATISNLNVSNISSLSVGSLSVSGSTVLQSVSTGALNTTVSTIGYLDVIGNLVVESPNFVQQGPALVGTSAIGTPNQGSSVSMSPYSNVLAVGGPNDNSGIGAVWVYALTNGIWSQQGSKLIGSSTSGSFDNQGQSTSISGDGNTIVFGAPTGSNGATYVFINNVNSGGWTQLGPALVGSGAIGTSVSQGYSVSLSSDCNTLAIGGPNDNLVGGRVGATWIFIRSGTGSSASWSQQSKLIGTGYSGIQQQGSSVSLSSDGNTLAVGGPYTSTAGATWVFSRTGGSWAQQGSALIGTGAITTFSSSLQGSSVSLSSDGNTLAVGGSGDNNSIGATWIFTRSWGGSIGTWSQSGSKIIGSGYTGNPNQGSSVCLSPNANYLVIGGTGSDVAWLFQNVYGSWTQMSIFNSASVPGSISQGYSIAMNNNTIVSGDIGYNGYGATNDTGGAFVFSKYLLSVNSGFVNIYAPTYVQNLTSSSLNVMGTLSSNIISSGELYISGISQMQNVTISNLDVNSLTIGNFSIPSISTSLLNVSGSTRLQAVSMTSLNVTNTIYSSSISSGILNVSGYSQLQNTTIMNLNVTNLTTGSLLISSLSTSNLSVSGITDLQGTSVSSLDVSGSLSSGSVTTSTLGVSGSSNLQSISTGLLNASVITTSSLNVSGLTSLQTTYAYTYYTYSDSRFKSNIVNLSDLEDVNVLNKVCEIESYTYDMFGNTDNIGFVAQQLETIGFDNLINTNENGYKSVNYISVIPLLVQSIKELKKEVDQLRNDLDHF